MTKNLRSAVLMLSLAAGCAAYAQQDANEQMRKDDVAATHQQENADKASAKASKDQAKADKAAKKELKSGKAKDTAAKQDKANSEAQKANDMQP